MELYGFEVEPNEDGDPVNLERVLQECYNDFETKSIQKGVKGGAFHVKVQVEQKEHG